MDFPYVIIVRDKKGKEAQYYCESYETAVGMARLYTADNQYNATVYGNVFKNEPLNEEV